MPAVAVTLISSAEQVEADAAPGLVVLLTEEPAAAAAAVAARLGTEPPASLPQALAELEVASSNSTAEDVAVELEKTAAALAAARQEAADALARVPPGVRNVAPERILAAAAAVDAARAAAVDARALLGERPELANEAAEAALAAEEALRRAREQRTTEIGRCANMLLAANAVAIVIVAGRIRTVALDPLFVLVAACPLLALVFLLSTWIKRTRQSRAAVRLRSDALRATGLATMTGMAARHARLKAWTARADSLAQAEASLAQARHRWAGLAAAADPREARELVRAMAEADRATAALVELESRPAPPPSDPWRGLVVLFGHGADDVLDEEARLILEQLEGSTAPGPVILVSASAPVASWAAARSIERGDADVVHLNERVRSSLDRLRARAGGFTNTAPPSSLAADG